MTRPLAQITPRELAVRLRCKPAPKVLDVRELWELQLAALEGVCNVPMAQVPENLERLKELQGDCDLVVMCHSGKRSEVIARFLLQNGFTRIINLDGGINGWSDQVDQSVPTY